MGNKKLETYLKLPKEAKPIPGYPTYYATPNGEIWRDAPGRLTAFGMTKPRIFKLTDRYNPKNGYYQIQPYVNGKKTLTYTHRLVLSAFKGWPGDNYECNHIDANPHNNNISNLEWLLKEENLKLIKRFTGKRGPNKKESNSKWKNIKPQILQLRKEGKKVREISLELGIPVEVVYLFR